MSYPAITILFKMYTSIFQGNTKITQFAIIERGINQSHKGSAPFSSHYSVSFSFLETERRKLPPLVQELFAAIKVTVKKHFILTLKMTGILAYAHLYSYTYIKLQAINKNKGTIDHVFGTVSNFSRPLAHVCNIAWRKI